jgi:4-amino-4-deoxy-L-arabinose transferase-like glycosyltransferase
VFYSPWNLVLLAVAIASLQAAFRRAPPIDTSAAAKDDTAPGRSAYRFLLAWTITYLVFFSLAATQLPHYVFPLYPPLAILTARYLERWRQRLIAPAVALEWVAWSSYVLVGVVAAIGLLVVGGAIRLPLGKVDVIPGLAIWSLAALLLPGAAGVALALRVRELRTAALGALWLGALAFVALLAAGPPLSVERLKAPRDLARTVQQHTTGRTVRLASLSYFQPSLVYYFGPVVHRLPGTSATRELLEQSAPSCVLVPEGKWRQLAPQVEAECRVIGRQYDLYTREEVVAVCNFPPAAHEARAERSTTAGRRR